MKLSPSRTGRRAAFTLLELLVVVAIIAVLASLLLAGIFRALLVARQVQTRNEISQLSAGISNFQTDFSVGVLPSYIDLSGGDPNSNAYLSSLYPQALPGAWAGNPTGSVLQGNAALVFFLQGPNGQGFSSDSSNPYAAPFQGEIRKGPYFTFATNRLANVNGQLMYLDPYGPGPYSSTGGQPYAYFAANMPNNQMPYQCVVASPGSENQSIGCPGPYVSSLSGLYINPNSYQIISAGPATSGFGPYPIFNPGHLWPGVTDPRGMDDIANFAAAPLGAGQ